MTAIAETLAESSRGEMLYRETGDARWLDATYERRNAGHGMAAHFRRREKAEKERQAREAHRSRARADPVFAYLKAALATCKKNAARKGRESTMTGTELLALYEASGGRCQITGIPFDCRRPRGIVRAPYAPSLDRIDNAKGYVPGNVRLVCQIANLAMNVWGADTLRDFIAKAK